MLTLQYYIHCRLRLQVSAGAALAPVAVLDWCPPGWETGTAAAELTLGGVWGVECGVMECGDECEWWNVVEV